MHKVISTGSKGNAVLYNNQILIDCGVPYSLIKQYENSIKIVLLTHVHKDHINVRTLKKLQSNRPSVRIGCGEWMLSLLSGLNNIDIYQLAKWYNYGQFRLATIKLFHDVENIGYRLDINGYKIIHATDTKHLQGITAKDYDLYSIESNYDEERAEQAIRIAKEKGEFCHASGSIESHLSHRQAWDFYQGNRKDTSRFVKLHQSTHFA